MTVQVKVRSKPDRETLQLYYICPLTGRDVTKSAGTSSRQKAERAAATWEQELALAAPVQDPSWESFRKRFEDDHLEHKALRTKNSYMTAMNQFERVIGKPIHISRISASVMNQLSTSLLKQGYPASTTCNILRHVKGALSWAAKLGMIQARPSVLMPSMSGESQMHGRPLTAAEFESLVSAVSKTLGITPDEVEHWKFFLRGLWLSGLRLNEAKRLSWEVGRVRVEMQGGKYPRIAFGVKGQKSRRVESIPMTPDFFELLQEVPEADRTGKVFNVPSRAGRIVSEIGEASGIVVNEEGKFASAHDLRRSFGFRWSRLVMPLVLRKMMRHKDFKTTLAFYVDHETDELGDDIWKANWCTAACTDNPATTG